MKFGMVDSLVEELHYLTNVQQDFIQKRLKTIALTIPQARTLHYISTNPGTIQKDLAHYLGKQHASVTNILKVLEQQNYLIREIPKENERQKKLYLTKKGQVAVEEVKQIFMDVEEKFNGILSNEEKFALMNALKKVSGQF